LPPPLTTRRQFVTATASSLALLPLAALAELPAAAGAQPLRVVCVGAHPDDPESGCGGTLRKLAVAGHHVTALYLTRGEAGIAGKSHAESATIRTGEATKACAVLGVAPAFLSQVDGSTTFAGDTIKAMELQLAALAPDLVFTHWPLDTHPDHQVAASLVVQARERLGRRFELYFYEVCTGEQSLGFRPTDYVDITDVRTVKRDAVYCHASQDPAAIYASGNHALMETFRGAEFGVAAAEAFVRLAARNSRPLV
jgi:LmbE family N-acetylglucosaminyl deacetylase